MKNKLILKKDTQFDEAIKLLDANGSGVLPVVDKSNKLIGIITDGDIRKAILHKNLDLEHIINKNPSKINISTSILQRVQFLKKIQRRHLPLVDNDDNYLDMFTLDDIDFKLKPNWIVIMAGGLGTRLGELTKHKPKPMLNVAGKPILERIIENFIQQGFSKFYLSVNYKKEIIKDYFGNGSKFGIEIKYLEEDKRLGTAGALSLIDDNLKEPLMVINGDIITSINFNDLLEYHDIKNSIATMCVRKYNHTIPYGVVESKDNEIISLKEKPQILFNVNTGIYVLNPEILQKVPKDIFYDMPTLFSKLIENDMKTWTYQLKDYWIDVGHPDDFEQANLDAQYN